MIKAWLVFSLGVVANYAVASGYLIPDHAPLSTATVPAQGSLEVAFSPGPAPLELISRAINRAQHSILVEAYSFTAKPIAAALLAAKRHGVDVRLILDKSQLNDRYSAAHYFNNQGIPLRIAVKYAIFHNKVMIIDDNTVITGSFNYTAAAANKNAENVLIVHNNPSLAKIYTQAWKYYWQHAIPLNEFGARVPTS